MRNLIFNIKHYCLKLARSFDNPKSKKGQGFFGFGQFVVLLLITPYILNLTLYSFSQPKEIPSLYQFNIDRFNQVSIKQFLYEEKNYHELKKPPKPRPLSEKQKTAFKRCKLAWFFKISKKCINLDQKDKLYKKEIKNYFSQLKKYQKEKEKEKEKLNKRKKVYYKLFPEFLDKPKIKKDDINIEDYSMPSFISLIIYELTLDSWSYINTLIWLIGLILILPAIWLCFRKKFWGLLIFGLSIPTYNYIVFFIAQIPKMEAAYFWQINSPIIAQIAMIWFAIKGHITTRSFGFFIVLLLVLINSNFMFSDFDSSFFKAQLPLLIFLMAAITARFLVKSIKANAYLFAGEKISKNMRKVGHAFLLWLPLGLIALSMLYLTQYLIPKNTIDQLHNDGILRFNYAENNILDNGLQSIAEKTDDAIFVWYLTMQDLKYDVEKQGKKLLKENLRKRVEITFDKIMPKNLSFDEYHSDKAIIGDGIEIAVDAAQKSTNKAFQNLRKKMRKKLGETADKHNKNFKSLVEKNMNKALEAIETIYQDGVNDLLEISQKTQNSFWWTYHYLNAMRLFLFFIFVFICFKSYLYVFSRVCFNRDSKTLITLGKRKANVKAKATQSSIQAMGLEYLIQSDSEEIFYISRHFQCRGRAPKYVIPQAFKAILGRLLTGTYSMNKVSIKKGETPVQCTATQGIEFFEWTLEKDEIVLFDLHNFVGMSDSIKISTLISTRVSSLVLGKMIYTQATGPGKIILMAKGRAEIVNSELKGQSVPPERIIATQKDTRFYIDSEIDFVNIYLSSAYICPAGGGKVIIDVDSQRGNKTGLMSFTKRFMLPI